MDARLLGTGHSLGLAMASDPSLVAGAAKGSASVSVVQVMASGAVHARALFAVRDLGFAVRAHESGLALAGVGSLAGVEAGASVLAGLVVGAEVQVLVAEETAPALVALALPRLLAGAVDAARVGLALGAQGSLPAGVATVEEKRKEF